ncbi:hypothetical protein UFOVP38_9 [uncultured Caudovirales phage]|uniref:Uncharacterized protein n=1 Tax=uncultured Caudovirales phage TaxID=2100421 RepID=A0A6J5T721_9CAUD|nr:hypothetical protein UFOVP38_9 [uncultured Caudovirales phage]
MAKLTTPIPQDKIGESFVWREWFQKLSDKVFGDLATQNAHDVNITGGSITGINFGVTSVIAGSGVSVSSPTGDVVVSNSGVTSLTAGANISVSSAAGNVTVATVGASGTFLSGNLPTKTITVVNGIITSIV